MNADVIVEWQHEPPETIVTGDGCIVGALASCLGASPLTTKDANDESATVVGGTPLVLDGLKNLLFVVSESMAPADALHVHDNLWNCTARLTAAGDQHDLAFVFVLPPGAPLAYVDALALGLGLGSSDWANCGYGAWDPSDSLSELTRLLCSIQPSDLVASRARRTADVRQETLKRLWRAVNQETMSEVSAAAKEVTRTFSGVEYGFDVFCCHPSHRNGNMFRNWLRAGVTGPVTPEWCKEGRDHLPEWLTVARGEQYR